MDCMTIATILADSIILLLSGVSDQIFHQTKQELDT